MEVYDQAVYIRKNELNVFVTKEIWKKKIKLKKEK